VSIRIDTSDLNRLIFAIEDAPENADANAVKAMSVNALKIKRDWQEPLKGSAYLPGGAASVTYDVTRHRGSASAEIGPELKGQGPLVGMLEYGTPNTGPRGYGAEALRKNVEDIERGLGKAVGDAL